MGLKKLYKFTVLRNNRTTLILFLLLGIIFLFFSLMLYQILPTESDWSDAYRPATLALLEGKSPYSINPDTARPFLNAPWILIPLIPLAILPVQISRVALFLVSIIAYAYIAVKLGAKPLTLGLFLLSFPVIYGLIYGQIDWLISFGYIVHPALALCLLLAKPQIGIAYAVYIVFTKWRDGGFLELVKTVTPVFILLTISLLLFGNWLGYTYIPVAKEWNTSLWPQSLPIGLGLVAASLRSRKSNLAVAASPFLSPYLAAHSWATTLLGFVSDELLSVVLMVGIWIVWLLGGGPINR